MVRFNENRIIYEMTKIFSGYKPAGKGITQVLRSLCDGIILSENVRHTPEVIRLGKV